MTPQRFARLQQVLDRRQPDLAVLLDNVHKPHNLAAVVRSCDAVGVPAVHAVWPDPRLRPHHDVSAGAGKWLDLHVHETLEAAVQTLHAAGQLVYAAHLSPQAVEFRELDYTRPCALLLGAELDGVSDAGARLADRHVVIPMLGMTASLNVSVAAAVILFEAQRQRAVAGLYDRPRLGPAERARLLFEWAHPAVARWCRSQDRPYPPLDEDGEIGGRVGAGHDQHGVTTGRP